MSTWSWSGVTTWHWHGVSTRSRSMRCLHQLWGSSYGCTRLSCASEALVPFRAILVTRPIQTSLAFNISHHTTPASTWVCGLHDHSHCRSAHHCHLERLRHPKETMPLGG
ncbi:unnamed protein product [Rangifer tarandus platyrhynchus]|uniref:Secreted protein n=1 Tax=Rangifer tarandus platyrhynchus TaxID=3082113 RepID=A0ABN8XMV5_RANTA|nr:unnamed protein product [Rangifer tarandus platyrhynchus]